MSSANAPERRIRLLWLIDSLTVGGAESLVVSFARGIDRSRYDLSVVCMTTIAGNAIETVLTGEGVEVVNLGSRNLRDLSAFRRLLHVLRERRIDIIHAHLTYASIWAAVASRLTRIPSVATLHVAPPRAGRAAIKDRLMRFALQRWASRVIAVSEALRQQYLATNGLAEEKIVALHNGIDVGRFDQPREECRDRIARDYRIPPEVPLAVTVSVLRPRKGIEVLLDAVPLVLEELPNAHFLIVGDGPLREEWETIAQQKGLAGRVRWSGYRSDVETLLSGCDLFVLPSLEDAFPTVLLEAMAAGLPVVASAVGGIPEIVVPGTTGRLVPPGDSRRLATAIRDVLSSPSEADPMRAAAREIARQHFSTDAWITRLTRLYAEVLH